MSSGTSTNAGPADRTGKEGVVLDSLHELPRYKSGQAARSGRPLGLAMSAVYIRELIRQRRVRESLVPAGLFSDPAWDILLDLTAARMEGLSVSISSACIAANVPTTTALRWINQLVQKGLLVRKPDHLDGRRATVTTTDCAQDMVTSYLSQSAERLAVLFASQTA